jgi:aminoglycoside phosphotransferase (APT) family kinase protein
MTAAPPDDLGATLAWVEKIVGGTVVAKRQHARWRPQWFLDVKRPSGEIKKLLLRGFRRGAIVDPTEARSRERLQREGGVLAALQATDVRVPRFFGYEPEQGWVLMECVEGDEKLTDVRDPRRQTAVFEDYLQNVACLHDLEWQSLGLPDSLFKPRDAEDAATWNYRANEAAYLANPRGPDPLYALARRWLATNRPTPAARWSLCTGDIGANQFFFEGERLKSMFDFEMAYIGDPLQDIGLMRYRNMCYPIAGFSEALDGYLRRMGRREDRRSLEYWTVVGMLGASLTYMTRLHHLDPRSPAEMLLLLAITPIRRRGLAEILHRIHGFSPPARPAVSAGEAPYTPYFAFVAAQLSELHLAREPDNYELRNLHSYVQWLGHLHRAGCLVTEGNILDLASSLGHKPQSESAGLAELEEAVSREPQAGLEQRLNTLYRIECRNEELLAPVMQAAGFAIGVALDPIG